MSPSSQTPAETKTVEELALELFATTRCMVHGEQDAQRLLVELRKVWLNQAADFLGEIGTPIHGERTEHERGVMYAADRLRAFATESGAA